MKNSKNRGEKGQGQIPKRDKTSATDTPRFPSIDIKSQEHALPLTTPKRYPLSMNLPEAFRFSFQRTQRRAKTVNDNKEQSKQSARLIKRSNNWLHQKGKIEEQSDSKSFRSIQSLKDRLASRSTNKKMINFKRRIQSNSSVTIYRLFEKNGSQPVTSILESTKQKTSNMKVSFFKSRPKNGAPLETERSIKSLYHRPKPALQLRGIMDSNAKIDLLSKVIHD